MDQKYALDAEINKNHESASNSILSPGAALKQYGARLCSNPDCRIKEAFCPKQPFRKELRTVYS